MRQTSRQAAVFISFSSPDREIAQAISEHLDSVNISTFFAPRDVVAGMNFALEIVKAIAACDAVLVLLSDASLRSPHVRREVSLAIDERRPLLPVALPGTNYPTGFSAEWTYWLSAVQVAEYAGVEQVAKRLRAILPTEGDDEGEEPAAARRQSAVARRRSIGGRRGGPSSLLRPDSGVPTLLGREGELARLERWCLRSDDFDVRLLVGGAGQGKSRLARELAAVMETHGWRVRHLQPSARGTDAILDLTAQPTLLVIDYAETRTEQLFEMFTSLLHHGVEEQVRLLLLARTAADWWTALVARDVDVADLVADVTIQAMEPLTNRRDLVNELFITACQQFAREVGGTPNRAVSAPYKKYVSVLDVLEDALIVTLGESPGLGGGTNRLLSHERRYLAASARAAGILDVDDVDLNRIAAALTLYGASNEDEAVLLIEECNRDLSPISRRQLARLFRRLYPGKREYVDGIRPDALAEDLLEGVLQADGVLPAGARGLTSDNRTIEQRKRALTTLARGAMRHQHLGEELRATVQSADLDLLLLSIEVATQVEQPDTLSTAVAQVVDRLTPAARAALLAAVPDETVALADFAAQLSRHTMADLPPSSEQTLEHSVIAMMCSNRFSDAGWSLDAVESAKLAVERLRVLAVGDRELRILGRALSNLSNRLWELGELRSSVAPAKESVETLDRAAAPTAVRVAASSNMAFRLLEVGDHDGALAAARAAKRLVEGGIDEENVGMLKTRGTILNNLCCVHLAVGLPTEAMTYGQQCVDLRRSQALQNRDRYLPYVARALANAAPAAEAVGDTALSDQLIAEARALHRLTGMKAPIFRFEEAESATLEAILLIGRHEWKAAERSTGEAEDVLASIPVDLRHLAARLRRTLQGIRAAVRDQEHVDIVDAATGRQGTILLPRLLEYRDL